MILFIKNSFYWITLFKIIWNYLVNPSLYVQQQEILK